MRRVTFVRPALFCAAALLIATPATAQTISIVTTPAGSYTNSVGAAVAKAIFDHAKLRAVVRPQATIGFDEVESGGAEFNVSNAFDSAFFVTGTGDYEGRGAKPGLRLVGALLPFRVAMHVRADSALRVMADLKGKRVSSGFVAQKTVGRTIEAHLANAGLSYNDVVKVPTPNVAGATQDFTAGKVDVVYFALGSGSGKQAAASVGGLRVLAIDAAPDAVRRLQALLPGAYVMGIEPEPGLDGVTAPTDIDAFDVVLNTAASVPDDVVYRVAKAIHESARELAQTFAPFRLFDPRQMAKPLAGVPMHPGAMRFYREAGLMK
jgi:TRAP transporter TAXI family solute receptor